MICYLPFTHIGANPFEQLAHALGPITVYSPSQSLVSEPMNQWQQQGLLDCRIFSGVDDSRLYGLLEEFKSWARLHDGHIGDMVHFFNTTQGRPPMVDETAPSQLRTQIRQFGQKGENPEEASHLQAALFLALAQEYDLNQERLSTDLEAVADMEHAMFATIGGNAEDAQSLGNSQTGNVGFSGQEDPGGFMTEQRLMAWARMVLSEAPSTRVYVTPSAAVFDNIKGALPDAVNLPTWFLNRPADQTDLKQKRGDVLDALCAAQDLEAVSQPPEVAGHADDGAPALKWIGSPVDLLETLCPGQSTPAVCNNTVIGLLAPVLGV